MATKDDVIETLKEIIDPELFIDIWTLGLIYGVEVEEGKVDVKMTFTSMACPAGPQLVEEVRTKTSELEGVEDVNVEVVFTPPWQPSDELKAMLGI
ncbi:MAG: metal-sulfur cluster assembly factor [Bdellovibrionales bacterium]|nr:metal-sulfur cluster assembly factor [Bdellovibrionales bacterium]